MSTPDARAASRLDVRVEVRVRQGWARVRAAWFPILQASIAAAIAFAIARYAVGHPYPFFAPVSAWVALGFTTDRSVRRVAELAVGVAIGVALGDLLVHLIGNGAWQVAVVLFLAAIIARFIDRGQMLTTQAGVQALVIVGLPAISATGGPLGRWIDAAIGGAVALAVALLTPRDPRRHPRTLARAATEDLAGVLRILARGLRTGSTADVEDALVRGRASQPALDEWSETATNAGELARVSPTIRKHRAELAGLAADAVLVDRAMRNARVLARRCLAAVEAQTHDMTTVADAGGGHRAGGRRARRGPRRGPGPGARADAAAGGLRRAGPVPAGRARLAGAEPGAAAPLAGRRPAGGGGRRRRRPPATPCRRSERLAPVGARVRYGRCVDVSVSALRAELRQWIEAARAGEDVVITERGIPVARLSGIEAADLLTRLERDGLLTPASAPRPPARSTERSAPAAKGGVSDLVRRLRR